jgi:hypothetical protein
MYAGLIPQTSSGFRQSDKKKYRFGLEKKRMFSDT